MSPITRKQIFANWKNKFWQPDIHPSYMIFTSGHQPRLRKIIFAGGLSIFTITIATLVKIFLANKKKKKPATAPPAAILSPPAAPPPSLVWAAPLSSPFRQIWEGQGEGGEGRRGEPDLGERGEGPHCLLCCYCRLWAVSPLVNNGILH